MDAQGVYLRFLEYNGWEEELPDSEKSDGVTWHDENCEVTSVNFEEVFPTPYEQSFTDGYAEGQTNTNDVIYENAYGTGYNDG